MQSLELRKVSRESLAHWRDLGTNRTSIEIFCAGTNWLISIKPIATHDKDRLQIIADWGGAHVFIRLHESWIGSLASQLLHVDFSSHLPDELRPLVFEAAFSDVADALEDSTRKRFGVSQIGVGETNVDGLHGFELAIDDGQQSTDAEVWLDDRGLGFLANASRGWGKSYGDIYRWDDLPVVVNFCIGWTDLAIKNYEDVEKHDVILLDECLIHKDNTLYIMVGRRSAIKAQIDGKKISVIRGLEKIMQDEEHSNPETQLDEIDIRLSFDLGERVLTLAELRLLSAGYIFDLGRDLRKSVYIRANGKIIGEGELVDIEGQTGVSVLNFAEKIS
jgi:type III secretion protein Q